MNRAVRTLLFALSLLQLAGCDSGVESFPADHPQVEAAWDAYHASPSHDSYLRFLKTNGRAAHGYPEEHDATGIRYQLRALDVQASEAVRSADEEIAWQVLARVRELEEAERLELYEEVLPGSRERFESAHERARAVLGE